MKSSKSFLWLSIIGLACIGLAWVVRTQVQSRRSAVTTPARDPQQEVAEKELVTLREAVRLAPADASKRWALIEFYQKYDLTDKAGEQILALIKLDPKDVRARMALADALLKKKSYVKAELAYRDVIDMDPKSLAARKGLAAALMKQQRYLEANIAAQHALELSRDDPSTHLLLATSALEYAVQFPDPAAHTADLDFARTELTGLTRVLPNNGEVYFHLGRACEGLHDRQGAIANLERAYALLPSNQEVGRMLAIAYRASNRDDAAQALLEKMVAVNKNSAPNYDLLGQIYQSSTAPDGPQKALAAFKSAVALQPDQVFLQERLGSAQYQTGDMAGARASFEKATQLDPNRSYAFQKLAVVYTRLGDSKRASEAAKIAKQVTFNEQQLSQMQELTKKHPDSVNLHLLLAQRYRDLKLPGPSRDEYLHVLRLDPKNVNVPKEIAQAAQASALFNAR